MSSIKYLTLEGLSLFKSKLDKLFAAHISGAVTSEGISLYLNNNIVSTATSGVISGDKYENIDSVAIPGATATHAGAMLPSHVNKLNALPTAAFTKITNGTSTVEADSAADTLTLTATTGVSVYIDPTNDKITIGHSDTSSVTTTPVGPSEDTEQTAETSLEFTVPQITVDEFGHVTELESRTITVKDTNTKTTEDGHYDPYGIDGKFKKEKGSAVTNNNTTVTFLQSVLVDIHKHVTKATYGTITIPKYPDIPNLEVGTTGTGNVVTDVEENGEHKITVTKNLSVYSKGEVDEAINAAKAYADSLELSKFDFKGDLIINATTTTANGPAVHNVGDIYRIATAGNYFGSTYEYQVGDFVLCTTSGITANAAHWASLNTNWQVVPAENPLIGTTYTTIATIGGVDIKAKIASYSPSNHNHDSTYKKIQTAKNDPTASGNSTTFIATISQDKQGVITATKKTIDLSSCATSGHNHDETYKKIQTAVDDPTADGTGITFIDTISQNTQGVITPHKKTIRSASTTSAGIVKLVTGDLKDSTSTTDAAAAKHTHSQYSLVDHNHDEAYSKPGHTHTTADITGDLITKINAGTGIGTIAEGRTPTISIKAASTGEIGGIKIWDKASYTVTATKTTISNHVNGGKYYAVQTDKNDNAFVYVPWQNDNTTYTATDGLSITNTVIKTVRKTEQTATGSIESPASTGKSNYITKAPILLDTNAMYTEIENITKDDIDALFN